MNPEILDVRDVAMSAYAVAHAADSTSACSSTVCVAFCCAYQAATAVSLTRSSTATISTIRRMMWRGVRNWPFCPAVTFARLLLEIRRRAASLPSDLPRSTAIEQAAREVLDAAGGQEDATPRKIMAAVRGIGAEQDFDAGILDALTPEMVLRLDVIADRMLEFGHR